MGQQQAPKLEDTGKESLRMAAAQCFMQDPQVAVNIAGVTTANFIQSARKSYKGAGFTFDDNDLREIHRLIRANVVRAGLGQAPPESPRG